MSKPPATVRTIRRRKGHAPLVCLTAYTTPLARLADEEADLILVGDSVGMVLYGMETTLPVTLDMMIAHGRAVTRGAKRACVIVDMPFGGYQKAPEAAYENAARMMAEPGAQGVKLEGGREMAETISFLVSRGIPVLGHVGLKPQSVHAAGGFRTQGRDTESRATVTADARAVAEAGAFAVVLESVVRELAAGITEDLNIPTIGIGAGPACDGQILVTEDFLGLTSGHLPRFVKPYDTLTPRITTALSAYAEDVREGRFPADEHCFSMDEKA